MFMNQLRTWAFQLKLWPRMALAITFGFIVLFLAFWLLGERALQESTDRILAERLAITQMVANQLDGFLIQAIHELEQAMVLADFDATDPDLSAETNVLEHTLGEISHFTAGIVFLDAQGRVVLSNPPGLYTVADDLSVESHIAAAMQQQSLNISPPFRSTTTNQPVVAITIPILHQGELVSLISGLINLDSNDLKQPLVQAAALGQTAHAVLVDAQGKVLISTFHLPFLSPGEHFSFYQDAMLQGQPTIQTVPFELELPNEPLGHLHVMAYVPLKTTSWGVAIGGDVGSETFAGVYRLRLGLALLSLTTLVVTWGVTLIGTNRLVRPVQQLTNIANDIAAGRLDVQLNVTDGGEIGVMASALDNMRRQLLANIEKLSQWNEVLEARVTAQTRELQEQQELTKQLLHRTISAQEEERGRIARELHDEFGQTLTAIELNLTHLEQKAAQHNGLLSNNIQQCRQLTHQSITELRRIVTALRPGVLDQLGLVASLHWISQQFLAPQGIHVAIQVEPFPSDLSKNIETILFRIVQEAVNNIVRHSQAKNVSIRLSTQADQLHLIIQDDGTGYESRPLNGGVVSQQLGLAGMQERASLVGGVVEITSQPQMGTLVHVTVPVSPDSQVNLSRHKDETLL